MYKVQDRVLGTGEMKAGFIPCFTPGIVSIHSMLRRGTRRSEPVRQEFEKPAMLYALNSAKAMPARPGPNPNPAGDDKGLDEAQEEGIRWT